MDVPETRYAKTADGVHIAYKVLGSGPLDLVVVPGWVSNVEVWWDDPSWVAFFLRLASFCRVILFDKRGTGLSDRISAGDAPTLEQRMDDTRAVMDAACCERAAVLGWSEGGPMSMLFAATYPERTQALILYGSFPRLRASEDYPWGFSDEFIEGFIASVEDRWGTGEISKAMLSPSAEDDRLPFLGRFEREGASPGGIVALLRLLAEVDVRDVLGTIAVPTMVVHRRGDAVAPIEVARYLSEHIPGSRLVELEGDHAPVAGDPTPILDAIEEFLTGATHLPEPDRVLATVVFTDIVGSTQIAVQRGDAMWRKLLDAHHSSARKQVERHRGRLVKTTGDGILATFDGPGRAIRCACALRDTVRSLELDIRAGIHTGEVEIIGDDVGGIAVHIGALLWRLRRRRRAAPSIAISAECPLGFSAVENPDAQKNVPPASTFRARTSVLEVVTRIGSSGGSEGVRSSSKTRRSRR